MAGLAIGFTAVLTCAFTFGFAGGFTLGLTLGTTGLRYVALPLCTRRHGRHWLPWQLGQFLDVCNRAGIMRTVGTSYQFRHRELQHYPTPATQAA